MDDEGVVKAPMTRLRRRLSVEADEVKSPVATPTKKRGGRLATKPQLDLIDENATENVPKRQTRKTKAKEIVEAEVSEEKTLTPSRRSARIRSNTSLILETTQTIDSPRAKRAVRRTSQVGSDSEAPLTPARQTRRTRKDSSSSIDKPVERKVSTPHTGKVTEVIGEEPEFSADIVEINDTSARKSPRLNNSKSENTMPLPENNNIKSDELDSSNDKDVKSNNEETIEKKQNKNKNITLTEENDALVNASSVNLIKNMDTKKKNILDLNKTTSVLEQKSGFKANRHRTKSLTTIPVSQTNDENFFSDNEIVKKKKKNRTSITDQGDNVSGLDNEPKNTSLNKILSSKKITSDNNDDSKCNTLKLNKSININTETSNTELYQDDCLTGKTKESKKLTRNLFDKCPDELQTQIFVVDSDTDSIGKVKENKLDTDDQCVPVIDHASENIENLSLKRNDSCEPMDVDETIPQDITFKEFNDHENTKEKRRKSSLNLSSKNLQVTESSSRINRKSTSQSESQIIDKIPNENKSTLILSHLKETSPNVMKNMTESPKGNNNQQLSNTSDFVKAADADNKNKSSNYLTSTPLQQKSFKKLGMQIDTSIISPKSSNKEENLRDANKDSRSNSFSKSNVSKSNMSKKSNRTTVSNNSDSSDESEYEEEISKPSKFVDYEAAEAHKSYESGESQDEDERQYEQENEIIEKGETLETEDEISDDTDYEKDSFVVSSDAEDDQLLSGSGDNLSMSDNELKMTAKSKQKYNERKLKEQKTASREMYEARHKINNSDKILDGSTSKKNKRQRLDSSMLISDENDSNSTDKQPRGKKNKHQRIDSSQDITIDKSETSMTKKKNTRISTSAIEDNDYKENQTEMNKSNNEIETRVSDNLKSKDDPLYVQIKEEPKTPQKMNLSVVKITDSIEEVLVDENATLLKGIETSDPLQDTESHDESDSSTNEKIMNSYNTVLEELQNKSKKIKLFDTSLNENKKKKKVKEPIIEELNLTKPKHNVKDKNSKKNKAEKSEYNKKNDNSRLCEDDTASDSIDMRLLFPEDSNDSELSEVKNNQDQHKSISPAPDFIPLKKTEAQTDISVKNESVSNVDTKDVSLNTSKKKRISLQSQVQEAETANEQDQSFNFIIDTVGNKSGNQSNISVQNSDKKQKDKRKIVTVDDESVISIDSLFSSCKKKNKKTYFNNDDENEDVAEISVIPSDNTTPKSEKKNKKGKKSLDIMQDVASTIHSENEDIPNSEEASAKPKNKKNKKSLDSIGNISATHSECEPNLSQNNEVSITSSNSKNKKNKNLNSSQDLTQSCITGESPEELVQSNGNDKKRSSLNKLQNTSEVNENIEDNPAKSSGGKNKNKPVHDLSGTQIEEIDANSDDDAPLEISFKFNKNDNQEPQCQEIDENTIQGSEGKKSKKRKRKPSKNDQEPVHEIEKDVNEKPTSEHFTLEENKKKKRKLAQGNRNVPENKDESEKKMNKKRKARDDDIADYKAKVFKGNCFDKVTVTRLPTHILAQLGDKPNKENCTKVKKPNLISTTNFVVEERKVRRNKPSNYLEESVYLNDSQVTQKSKGKLKKPKVLPFIPTASTSDAGFTTSFKINVLPQDTKFVAQTNNITNFKDQILAKHKLKKFHTFETYKNQRNRKVANYF